MNPVKRFFMRQQIRMRGVDPDALDTIARDINSLPLEVHRVNREPRTFDNNEPLSPRLREALRPELRQFVPPPPVGDNELIRAVGTALEEPQSMNDKPITAADPSDAHKIMARAMLDELDRIERETREDLATENKRHMDAVQAEQSTHESRVATIDARLRDTATKAAGYKALVSSLEPGQPEFAALAEAASVPANTHTFEGDPAINHPSGGIPQSPHEI